MNDGSDTAQKSGASPEALAADIRATRRELAATVEALAGKTDVRARLRTTARRRRAWAREVLETARARARSLARRS